MFPTAVNTEDSGDNEEQDETGNADTENDDEIGPWYWLQRLRYGHDDDAEL